MSWNVAILYRRYHPDHSKSRAEQALRMVQIMHDEHGPYNHVEVLFRLPCSGGRDCPCRSLGERATPHHHRVAYSTSWNRGQTYRDVDRQFKVTRELWDIQRFQIDDQERLVAMLDFLDSQMGAPFGLQNLMVNFVLGSVWRREPLAFGRLKPTSDTPFVAAPPLKRQKKWFCSELVCATLIVGGLIVTEGTSPSITSPQILRELPKRFTLETHPIPLTHVDLSVDGRRRS